MQTMDEKITFTLLMPISLMAGFVIWQVSGQVNYISLIVFAYAAPIAMLMIFRNYLLEDEPPLMASVFFGALLMAPLALVIHYGYQVSMAISGDIQPLAICLGLAGATCLAISLYFRTRSDESQAC